MATTFRTRTILATTAATLLATVLSAPAATADSGSDQCTFSKTNHKYAGTPWALQRVNLDELWSQSKGKNVKVAVIDTGVDTTNPQLTHAVNGSLGVNLLPPKDSKHQPVEGAKSKPTTDTVGHGTRVAGIIAARPMKGTGFVGLAPEATIIPIKQNDAEGHGTATTLANAIQHAIKVKAQVINISQDTANAVTPGDDLHNAVNEALNAGIVVVASAGNDGLGGNVKKTYPASWDGVLAVAASDRNNERAAFSQSGDFVGVAAPGVDMISTVPKGGHCSDNGTSFSAPYVAGVAALIKAKHPKWTPREVVAQIEQTAERSIAGHDRLVGWGVVDPVRALTEDDHPIESPRSDAGLTHAEAPTPAKLTLGETPQQRTARIATYVAVGVGVLVAGLSGGAVAARDARRRRRALEART
ncbi:type VII secretion-associated serine protease mycosin [Streptomyces cellostaticus]|uniref:Type VII secretion-associated serine protease mycosin n=1 Tax=Streptomyces cellostaticus TaxID=67285 RepID=A0A101NDY8_9ACTN|nr:type VII secretion-associated serine protease mycosin [Streptomyces cellostaticus]KUM91339.1 type VII secretion-associated serine protease mycosin [Streptomyces cellostaticus]GHI04462.1 type VII secretion-associated serine protease [Streptomyces cellostaticus]